MAMGRVITAVLLACLCAGRAPAQDTAPPSAAVSAPATDPVVTHRLPGEPAAGETISLMVPKGTPVQVMLDQETRVRKVGQPIHGRVVEPVYAFDKLVIPAGAEVAGRITQIGAVSSGKRTAAALDADFTPARKVQIEFNDLALPDGKHIPIHTIVTQGSGQTIQFVSAAGNREEKKGVREAAAEKTREGKEQAKQEWDNALKQAKEPGKIHRIERYAIGELPAHPQYIDAGTVYFAELQEPLDFGTELLTPQLAASLANPTPPDGSVVHARLMTPLNSATTHQGDDVQAIVTKPLFDGDRLVVPEGSILKGSVVQVQAARRMAHNGQLRPIFHELTLPDGIEQRVEASLAAVQAGKAQDLKLDAEGGAEATTPKTRYLSAAMAVSLAAASQGDDLTNRAEGGAGGFRVVGIALGIAIRSQPLGMAMGALGASRSVYANFIARGRDVVFPKNTAMAIGIGTRPQAAGSADGQPAPENTTKQ